MQPERKINWHNIPEGYRDVGGMNLLQEIFAESIPACA